MFRVKPTSTEKVAPGSFIKKNVRTKPPTVWIKSNARPYLMGWSVNPKDARKHIITAKIMEKSVK